jgi:WD40 repeat protein
MCASLATALLLALVSLAPQAEAQEPLPVADGHCGALGLLPDGPARPKCELWKSRYNHKNGRSRAFDVVFSPDGSRVFVTGEGDFDGGFAPSSGDTGGDVATVAYDAVSGAELWSARYNGGGRSYDVGNAIAVSPDGTRVFVAGVTGSDNVTLAYDAGTGEELWVSRHDAGSVWDISYDIAVSPNGTRVFTTGRMLDIGPKDIHTVAYDSATGGKLWVSVYAGPAGLADNGTSVALSPDGNVVYVVGESHNGTTPEFNLTGMDLVVLAYDAQQGNQLWLTRYDNPSGGQDSSSQFVSALEVSPDGTRLFVIGNSGGPGAGVDYLTLAVDAVSGAVQWEARYDGPVGGADQAWAVGLSPDASRVYVTGESVGATSTDAATVAYDAGSGQQLWEARYDGPAQAWDRGMALAVASGGRQIIIGGQSNIMGVLFGFKGDMVTIAYDGATGDEMWNETYNGPIGDHDGGLAVAASPDGSTAVTTGWTAGGPPPLGLGVTDTGGMFPFWDYITIAYDVSGPEPPEPSPTTGDQECTAANPIVGETVNGNVVVPNGESCTLKNSTVNGDVKAQEDASIDATGNTIAGNVEGDKTEKLGLVDNDIGGNVTIKEGETPDGDDVDIDHNILSNGSLKVEKMAGDISITDNTVDKGDVEVIENTIGQDYELVLDGNRVAKNLKVLKNKGSGDKSVTNNEGGQDLECKDNDDPFTGSPNGTWSKKVGQCGP